LSWSLFPTFCHSATNDQLNRLLPQYQEDIGSHVVVSAEIKRWTKKWEEVEEEKRLSNAIEALLESQIAIFSNVRNLLQFLATLPVSTATAEQRFRTLSLLKTYLRTMESDQLTGFVFCQCIQTAPSTRRKFLKTLLLVKGVDQTLVFN